MLVFAIASYFAGCSNNEISRKKKVPHSTKIALLIPLESPSEQTNSLSIDLMNGARLAMQDLTHLNLKLSVFPTSGSPSRALHAAKAAIEDGIEIIVGPLFSRETAALKEGLTTQNFKVISLSNDPSVADRNIFLLGTTSQMRAGKLVEFAMSKGLNRIAVVGPEGKVGINGIEAASHAIKEQGATLSTISLYPLTVNGIRDSAEAIYRDLINSKSTAVILTDSPTKGLGFISEQISQLYDKNNTKKPQFMGITRWDKSQQILNEFSLDKGWFVIPDPQLNDKYQKRYIKTFGSKPNQISSLSYDAIALIGQMIEKKMSGSSYRQFQPKFFLDPDGFEGVNGIFRFTKNGTVERSLSIAEVNSGRYRIIKQAENRF